MIQADEIDDVQLIRSLYSATCPACGGVKKRDHTMCARDYFRLPRPMRKALYERLGEGYREAVLEALAFLGAETFHHPPAMPTSKTITTDQVQDGDA